jgi:hypothetical protein
MGKSICMSYGAENIQEMNARVERLDALYIQDGRDKKDHPFHSSYTGLFLKYNNAEGTPSN